MAVYTSATTSKGYYLQLTLSETVNETANTSTISYTLKMYSGSYYFSTIRIGYSLSVEGVTVGSRTYQNSSYYSLEKNSNITIATGTFTVAHDSDGAKAIAAGQIVFRTLTQTGEYAPNITASNGTAYVLTTIPRASSMTATNATMGKTTTFSIARNSDAFTHTITYSFGTGSPATGTITTKTTATAVTWTPPYTLAQKLAITGGTKSGTITYTLITYSGNTEIGRKTYTATLSAPPVSAQIPSMIAGRAGTITITTPDASFTHTITYSFEGETSTAATGTITEGTTATSVTWTPARSMARKIPTTLYGTITYTHTTYAGGTVVAYNTYAGRLLAPADLPAIVISGVAPTDTPIAGVYIQNNSKVAVSCTLRSDTGAYIWSASITIDGVTTQYDWTGQTSATQSVTRTSGVLANAGSRTITITTTDSRGRRRTTQTTINVESYADPKLLAGQGEAGIICARSDAAGNLTPSGTYLRIKVGRSISSLGGSNTGYIAYRIGTGSETVLSTSTEATIRIAQTINASLALTRSYNVTIRAYDTVGNSATRTYTITSDQVTLDLRAGGLGVGVGQYAQNDRRLEISPAWDVTGRVFGLGNLPQISSGEDLNSYHTPGRYAVMSNVIAASLSNCPSAEAGVLTVYASTGSMAADPDTATWQYILQEYRAYTGTTVHQRYVTVGATAGSWTYYPWYRTYPQPNAAAVALTYTSNPLITSANFTAGFTLHKTGPLCILSINAQPTSSTAATLTAIGNVPAGSRPKLEIVQTSIQQDTAFAPVAVDIGAASGNIFLYKPNASTARIRMIVPYFTDL